MNSINLLLDANPIVIGAVALVVVMIISVLEKRWRNSGAGRSDSEDPLGDGEKISFPSEEDVEEQENNYFPEPPNDLMPVPMNSMEPMF